MTTAISRLVFGTLLVGLVILAGGAVLWFVGGGQWSLGESIYMSVISAATVGFGELPNLDRVPGARATVVAIILLGIAAFAFLQSSLTAFFVEGALGEAFRRRRMDRSIENLSGHVVLAGAGSTGAHVVEELVATRTPFVVIDRDRAMLERTSQELVEGRMLFVVGEATEDHTLVAAGVERAAGVIAALTADRDNLYVTLSARSMNAKARIVSKVVELEAIPKMLRAGANQTVSPNTIGGRRMVSELLRPTTTEFLDQMLRDKNGLRFTEVTVPERSPVIGRTLGAVPIRDRTGALVVAVRRTDKADLSYNPTAAQILEPGMILVILGDSSGVGRLQVLLDKGA